MAKTHSTMVNGKGTEVSSTSNTEASVMVETWQVRIKTWLLPNGKYTITVSDRETGVTIEEHTGQYPQPGNSLEHEETGDV